MKGRTVKNSDGQVRKRLENSKRTIDGVITDASRTFICYNSRGSFTVAFIKKLDFFPAVGAILVGKGIYLEVRQG